MSEIVNRSNTSIYFLFKKELGGETKMAERFLDLDRSVIPACDVPNLGTLGSIAREVSGVRGIGALKVGLELVIPYGLPAVVQTIRRHDEKLRVIYDHQKGGTDIPDLGGKFAKAVKTAGADAAILFPQAGAKTHREWVKACQGEGLRVMVGGHMTHAEYIASEGGYITDEAPRRIYEEAAGMGVTDFIVPGNNPGSVRLYREVLEGILGKDNFDLYAPGFVAQGGSISEAGKAAGNHWHAIVGRDIYQAADKREAAERSVANILS